MSDELDLIELREAVRLLGRSPQWWYRHQGELLQKHAFPLPLPGPGKPLWRREEIIAWRDRKPPPATTVLERGDVVADQVLERAGVAG